MEFTVYFHDPDREPLTMSASFLHVTVKGPGAMGVSSVGPGAGVLVGEKTWGGSEVDWIDFSGHPASPDPEASVE